MIPLLLLLSVAEADIPPYPPPEPVAEPQAAALSVADLAGAAWAARTEAEQAAAAAASYAMMDRIRAAMAGAPTGDQKVLLMADMASYALYQGREHTADGSHRAEGELEKAAKLSASIHQHYPDSPHRFGFACTGWLAHTMLGDHDAAAEQAELALATAATPAQQAVARLLGAESLAAKGEAEAAAAAYASADAPPIAAVVAYRRQGEAPQGEAPADEGVPAWLAEVEAMLRAGRAGQ